MRKLIVAVFVLAGCAAQAPQEPPLPPGMVAIATFTAEVDPQSGTFSIRARPTAAGTARGMTGLEITEVTVDDGGNHWFNSTDDHGCSTAPGVFPTTWGAQVTVTSLLAEPTSLGGVYAEITSWAGTVPGNGACNSVPAPTGLNTLGLGLWYYDKIMFGGSATTGWTFNYAGGGQFSFSGRIVAAKVDEMTGGAQGLLTPFFGEQTIGDNGTNIVYAVKDDPSLQFVNYDGTNAGLSMQLAANPAAIAADTADGWVWYLSENDSGGWVGNVSSAGTAGGSVQDGGNDLGGLVVDPTATGRAWFRSGTGGYFRSITAASLFPILGSKITPGWTPYGLAFGPAPDQHLFITSLTGNTIMVYTSEGVYLRAFSTPEGCRGPASIMLGPDGKMWFSAVTDDAVCTATAAGDVAPMNDAAGPGQLAFNPDNGEVWVASSLPNQVARMDASGPGYRVTLPPTGVGASSIVFGGGKFWATNDLGVYRIEP